MGGGGQVLGGFQMLPVWCRCARENPITSGFQTSSLNLNVNEQESPFCTQTQFGNIPVKFNPGRICIANKIQVQCKIISNSCMRRSIMEMPTQG